MLQFSLNADRKSYTYMGVINDKIKKITIPKTHNRLPVTRIAYYAFAYCKSLKSIIIPNSVTEIDNFAFYCCTSLESIVVADSITKIGDYAFAYCTSLKSIVIPNGVTEIANNTFHRCVLLESVNIPNSVTKIGDYAFGSCHSLKSITIPNSVTEIGAGAFYRCAFTHTTRRFKATKVDNSCRNFIYEIGKWYHEDDMKLCFKGFHSCKNPLDIFNYYWGVIGKDVKLYEVSTKNESSEQSEDSKIVSQDICLLREISISELADIASGRV